jgi:predicted nucleic acid-binding protein
VPHFLDTNIVAYAFSDEPRSAVANDLLAGATISVQVLNELTNVARRKWGNDWRWIDAMLERVIAACAEVRTIDQDTNRLGRALAERYQLNIYDSFLVAAALLANCDSLFSEDMHHGLIVEDRLVILNPFA